MAEAAPVETLARLALQSDRYRDDAEFREAVDAVFNQPVFDAAPAMLAALDAIAKEATVANDVIRHNRDGGGQGRIRVATAMHRIAELARAAL